MTYQILYKVSVKKELGRLSPAARSMLLDGIEKEIAKDPGRGVPLAGEFKGLHFYDTGNCRVVYRILPGGVLILNVSLHETAGE